MPVPVSARRRLLIGLLTGVAVLLVPAVAGAHEPVFVTEADATPATGPLLEDGNHSWAVYGVLKEPDAARGVRTQLTAGQTLVVDLLIPDLAPEVDLAPGDLPTVSVRWPDGTTRSLESDRRVAFDEPFSNTSYVRIAELREPTSQTGVYELTVTGAAPARFTLATGTVEGFGGAQRDAEPVPEGGLAGWYATPPPTVLAAPSTTASSTTATDRPRERAREARSESSSAVPWLLGIGLAGVVTVATVLVIQRRRKS